MATYVWRDGVMVNKATGCPIKLPKRFVPTAPFVMSDIADYASPITGEVISGRRAQREDLRRNNCVLSPPPAKKRGYKNPRFAKKHGLPLSEE